MTTRTTLHAFLIAMAVVAASTSGCSSDDETVDPGTSQSSSTGATGGHGNAGGGGEGGTGNIGNQGGGGSGATGGGSGGVAGAGGSGGMSHDLGHQASDWTNAGEVSTSSNYQMVFTLGSPRLLRGR